MKPNHPTKGGQGRTDYDLMENGITLAVLLLFALAVLACVMG